MQKTDRYVPFGWEYEEPEGPRPYHWVVYTGLGLAALVLLFIALGIFDAGYHGYEVIRSFL